MPEQLYSLTMGEFNMMIKSRQLVKSEDIKRNQRLIAQLAAWLLTPKAKKPLTIDDFIRNEDEENKPKTADEAVEELAELEAEFAAALQRRGEKVVNEESKVKD